MDQLDATRVIGERARGPFFPSDGQWMRFFDQGQLKKIAVSGGSAPVTFLRFVRRARFGLRRDLGRRELGR